MKQTSLFDAVLNEPSQILVGIAGSPHSLSPSQRRFNQLVEQLSMQRRELDDWRAFPPVFNQQLGDHYQPALARLRGKQIEMVRFLDRTLMTSALNKRERAQARDMLAELLEQLLSESPDPELMGIYDRHAGQSFEDAQQEQQAEFEVIRTLASESFGIDIDDYAGGGAPGDFAEWLDEQLHASPSKPRRRRRPKKKAKTIARDAAAEGGTRAVRDVYRKLVSELHPDRETDAAEQVRKTQLMQRANRAYKAGDLLTLLELQLHIEQIDTKALTNIAEDRLRHYIHVLEEQSRRLRDERAELVAPFAMAIKGVPAHKLSPTIVLRSLEADTRDIDGLVRSLESDLARFQDIKTFKRSLRAAALDPFDDLDFSIPPTSRPRRRRPARRA
jgi:hypothetical protein